MKTATPELIAYLRDNHQFIVADLYTFTLKSGQVLRLTNADVSLTVGGQVFSASGPLIERSKLKWQLGLEVDELSITLYAGAGQTLGSQGFQEALLGGALDGAWLLLERLFLPAWGDTSTYPPIWYFEGIVGPLPAVGRSKMQLTVKSLLSLLDTQLPRNLYQTNCSLTHYSPACGVNRDDYTNVTSVLPGSTASLILCDWGPGYLSFGVVQMLTGALAGQRRTIWVYQPGRILLIAPFTQAPAPGDSFRAWAGCDKTKTLCESYYNNLVHFRGMPFIPRPETAH